MSSTAPSPPGQPLAGVRVVELAGGVAGPYAAKLFADFGADVCKVEPPGGDPARQWRLDSDEDVDLETGPLYLFCNTNKRSIVADPDVPADRALLRRLVASADILIESLGPGGAAAVGLEPRRLRAEQPGLVVVSLTPWGLDGPYAGAPGTDLAVFALAGPMSSTGIDELEPMKMAGRVIAYQAGSVAAMAAMAALRRRELTGRGAWIDAAAVDAQLGSIDRRTTYLLYRQFCGLDAPRAPASTQQQLPAGVYPTGDGHVQAHTISTWVPAMLATLGDEELAARYADPAWGEDDELPGLTEAATYVWMAERSRQQVMVQAQANRWPITAINHPVDLLDDEHFAERGSFVTVEHPRAGRFRTIGAPWRVDDGWVLRRPAPLLDQHRAEILAELELVEAGPSGPPAVAALAGGATPGAGDGPTAEDRLPLAGIRVLDLTVVWAGPYCTMLLGDLGAEVVRVDNPWVFPTATRGGIPRPPKAMVPALGPLGAYPDLDPGERPWNRHSMYSAHARNKAGVTLDLRTEVGRELFLRLVEQADVLVENNSAKVLDQLGIGWDVLSAQPRLIVVRMAPLGLSGPYRHFIGFGVHFEGLCGATAVRGYRDAPPTLTWNTFHMDPATGTAGTFAVLAALRRRERTGVGELVEFAQAENMMQHLGEYYVDASITGRVHTTPGNRDAWFAPQGCYRAGDGGHLVLTVERDEQWPALADELGCPAWAGLDRRRAWPRMTSWTRRSRRGRHSGPVRRRRRRGCGSWACRRRRCWAKVRACATSTCWPGVRSGRTARWIWAGSCSRTTCSAGTVRRCGGRSCAGWEPTTSASTARGSAAAMRSWPHSTPPASSASTT
ncbi:MAG: CoA transferase [Acidimicrobiales bacterium]